MISAPWTPIPFWKSAGGIEVQMTGGNERWRVLWTAPRHTPIDFVANHAGTLEPLHDHGQVLTGVVGVVEALAGCVRVEDRDTNHADSFLSHPSQLGDRNECRLGWRCRQLLRPHAAVRPTSLVCQKPEHLFWAPPSASASCGHDPEGIRLRLAAIRAPSSLARGPVREHQNTLIPARPRLRAGVGRDDRGAA